MQICPELGEISPGTSAGEKGLTCWPQCSGAPAKRFTSAAQLVTRGAALANQGLQTNHPIRSAERRGRRAPSGSPAVRSAERQREAQRVRNPSWRPPLPGTVRIAGEHGSRAMVSAGLLSPDREERRLSRRSRWGVRGGVGRASRKVGLHAKVRAKQAKSRSLGRQREGVGRRGPR